MTAPPKLDEVDVFLSKQDGQVQRERDPDLCRHNARQKCTNCLPVDPYDEEYLKAKDIKHMSFHSYIRKLTAGHGRGSHVTKPLENLTFKIDLTCHAHKPYPKGICTKCKPQVITLARQKFRHVDNIEIENQELVNEFLNYWRRSGSQRVGFLIGKYQSFAEVPLGIKATVAAIYEPPQAMKQNGIELLPDPHEAEVDKLLSWLGLQKVGWIFTDLWTANASEGTVHCIRNKDSFLLSAEECITSAWLQNKHKNLTQYCTEPHYGSKFVTLVASGDETLHVNFHGYQVSNQCAAMVEADILCPTIHTPELAYVRETPLNETHYITGVQYSEKNEFGAEVQKDGKPLPVEYLLVDVPTGVPKEPHYTFYHTDAAKFNIENRKELGEIQGGSNLAQYSSAFSLDQFLDQATNFHFLLYLMTNELTKINDSWMERLCQAIARGDRVEAATWASECTDYHHLVALSHEQSSGFDGTSEGGSSGKWACSHCTFENDSSTRDCSICGLPQA